MNISRREALKLSVGSIAAPWFFAGPLLGDDGSSAKSGMKLGLVTYNWGKDWDVPTIIRNCAATGFSGVELRSTHKHGVEISLNKAQRKDVRQQFEDSAVTLVGLGSACEYHSPDPAVLKKNIEETKAFVKLCHDLGASGVKVRPNGLPANVPVEKTLEQIGRSLQEVSEFAADYGVDIRLEVHGRGTSDVPKIAEIMKVATSKNCVLCWNCNPTDLAGKGLEYNFRLVQDRIGTIHIHDLRNDAYPWKQLFSLLKSISFDGWTLLEDGKVPKDIPGAMQENTRIWKQLVSS